MTYTTGISGTQGVETTNPDGTINPNDTQNIVVNTSSATLNINGAGGVDKFNIEASSFTKTLTIAGNLGTVPNYEEAKNNYDSVRIDLSKTSGVDLNISNLLVSNPNDEGIIITASKGADNITLVAGANHDVIEFAAGGGAQGAKEKYEVDLGTLRLAAGQSFSIDGLTITNVTGFQAFEGNPATSSNLTAMSGAMILTATEIAELLRAFLAEGASANVGAVGALTATAITKYVRIDGSIDSLKDGWLNSSTGFANVTASGATLTFENSKSANVTDLNFTFGGNGRTNGLAGEANKTQSFVEGKARANATVTGATATGAQNDYQLVDISGDYTDCS